MESAKVAERSAACVAVVVDGLADGLEDVAGVGAGLHGCLSASSFANGETKKGRAKGVEQKRIVRTKTTTTFRSEDLVGDEERETHFERH